MTTLPLISHRSVLWEHSSKKSSSFKRTHSSQFRKSLSSSLWLVFLCFWPIFLSRAPQTWIDLSQAPFHLFPVRTHHIHWSSFKGTHSRQFQSWPSSVLWFSFLLFSTGVPILGTADTDFSTHETICVWTLETCCMPNPTPPGCLLLISTQIGSNDVSFLTQQSQRIETITQHVLRYKNSMQCMFLINRLQI